MPSVQSCLLNGLLHILRPRRRWKSAAAVQEHVRRQAKQPASYRPPKLGRDVTVTQRSWGDWPLYHMTPSANPSVKNHIVFLHGGGYVNEIHAVQWRFVDWLTRHAPVHSVVPIFPLAPKGSAKHVVPTTGQLLRDLMETAGPENVSLIGNSAGAGLALATAQWLRDSDFAQPKTMVLISPWVDALINGQEYTAIAPLDPFSDIPGIVEAGRLYAGELDMSHPFVSPLRGDLGGLAPMVVFTGTHDILYPNSIALATKARQAGVLVDLHVQRGLPHNYPMLPTPEGREALAIIAHAVSH